MKKNNIDIIVPIYNAYEYTDACIESVINNTDLTKNNLILINDKSPDTRIIKLLKKHKKNNSDKNIIIIDNEENYGFVKTVNIGMKYSKNDVILLNSDTEVTKNWLTKLQEGAYSSKEIATVTPLTNNGTLASVPTFMGENEIPNGYTLSEYSDLIEKISFKMYSSIPTAVGFCMYIKQSVLDEIGYFDDETYNKGYGEENDFCYRALDYGYRHILCDDTFVYHKGTQSFVAAKDQYISDNYKKLCQKYLTYVEKTNQFCALHPTGYIEKNLIHNMHILKKPNILLLIHNCYGGDIKNIGGTTLHMMDIINGLKEHYNFHILYPSDNHYKVHSICGDQEFHNTFHIEGQFNNLVMYNSAYRNMIEKIFKIYNICAIHIHHIMGHAFDVIDAAKQHNIYTIMTLHDYYLICPKVNFLYLDEKYCETLPNKDCSKCLNRGFKVSNNVLSKWQNESYKMLSEVDKIITPSVDTKERFNKYFPKLEIEPIEHGIESKNNSENIKEYTDNSKFRVALIGAVNTHKGGRVLKELVKLNNNNTIEFHLFGTTDIPELQKNRKNYIFHGKYTRENLYELLNENNINLICLFSIWPETYSYTLTESLEASIPVLAFQLGAIGERILKHGYGYLIDPDLAPKEILSKLTDISTDKEEYNLKLQNIKKHKIKTTVDMNKQYKVIYDETIKNDSIIENDIVKEFIFTENNDDSILQEYRRVTNSIRWRLVSKIKVPSKLTNILRRVYRRFKK